LTSTGDGDYICKVTTAAGDSEAPDPMKIISTPEPTPIPTPVPTEQPTPIPTPVPTPQPTPVPTPQPTASHGIASDVFTETKIYDGKKCSSTFFGAGTTKILHDIGGAVACADEVYSDPECGHWYSFNHDTHHCECITAGQGHDRCKPESDPGSNVYKIEDHAGHRLFLQRQKQNSPNSVVLGSEKREKQLSETNYVGAAQTNHAGIAEEENNTGTFLSQISEKQVAEFSIGCGLALFTILTCGIIFKLCTRKKQKYYKDIETLLDDHNVTIDQL